MQIREEKGWIYLVKTVYRPAAPVTLADGSRAYRAGTGRSVPGWKAKVPANEAVLPPEIADQLSGEERGQVEDFFAARATRMRNKALDEAMDRVAEVMALAAEGYKKGAEAEGGDRLTPEIARDIWGAWKSLRGELQRRGFQERDFSREVPAESAPHKKRRQGGTDRGASPHLDGIPS